MSDSEERGIPCERAGLTGSVFLEATNALSSAAREEAIFGAIAAGSVPSFGHVFVDVRLEDGAHDGAVRVAVDYAAVGADEDFVRVPMSPVTAQRLADHFGYVLPTRKLVDAIYRAAELKLVPAPLPPGSRMMSNDYYRRHHEVIEKQRANRAVGKLIAGHKKDVVITKRLLQRPKQVAIYGWHRVDGRAIQPLSLVHEASYVDYSHGVRWVHGTMAVDGAERLVADVLRDPELAPLLSDEGPLSSARAAWPFR